MNNQVRAIYNTDTGKVEYQEIDSVDIVYDVTIEEIEALRDEFAKLYNGLCPKVHLSVDESRKSKRIGIVDYSGTHENDK
jgi:hypothetical protein